MNKIATMSSLLLGKNFRSIIWCSGIFLKVANVLCFTYGPCHKSIAYIKRYFNLIATNSIFFPYANLDKFGRTEIGSE